MIVMKFGGTSVGSAEAMRRVGEIVGQALPRKPVVVVSAVSKVTDRLLESARRASLSCSNRCGQHTSRY